MKAWLVLQEGPGAGMRSGFYVALSPVEQPVLSLGRSSQCDVVLNDIRASRHHADVRWDGQSWQIVDRGSTNGTFVNGMQVHRPYPLRLNDRITIGEATFVLRESRPQPATPRRGTPPEHRSGTGHNNKERARRERDPTEEMGVVLEEAVGRSAPARVMPGSASSGVAAEETAAFWMVQGLVLVAVVCLAVGAFLPWLRVQAASSSFEASVAGWRGLGKLTLVAAAVSAGTFLADYLLRRKSILPSPVYLLVSLVTMAVMLSDLIFLYGAAQRGSLSPSDALLGIALSEANGIPAEVAGLTTAPMLGLHLSIFGLVVLLGAGTGRLAWWLLYREK